MVLSNRSRYCIQFKFLLFNSRSRYCALKFNCIDVSTCLRSVILIVDENKYLRLVVGENYDMPVNRKLTKYKKMW